MLLYWLHCLLNMFFFVATENNVRARADLGCMILVPAVD